MYFFRKNKSSEKAIILNMTEPLMPVLYVAKPPVQTVGASCQQSYGQISHNMKCYTKYYSLLAVKSVLLSHHVNCFSGHLFINMGQLLTLILQATAYMQRYQHR
jgi:hypothetical protein